MILKLTDYIKSSQSIVFFDRVNQFVYKVFKSYQYLDIIEKKEFSENDYNKWKKYIYKTEIDAYNIISNSSVKKFFPKRHTNFNIEKIIDENDLDISNLFLLDCVIMLDLIEGESLKQNDSRVTLFCEEHKINLQSIFNELNKIGVCFHNDSSVFCNQNNIKIIDIGTKDFADSQPPLLSFCK
jgi:hypothetical protein